MRKSVWLAVALTVGATAREAQAAEDASLVPLQVQVVLTRTLADKKVSSMPYTMALNASDTRSDTRGAAVRMGIQIPLTVRVDANQPATVMFKDVGTNLDCRADALEGGRFNLVLSIEQGALASGDWANIGSSPVLRNFRSTGALILKDGQSGRYLAATDPVTGEVLQVEVSLKVVK